MGVAAGLNMINQIEQLACIIIDDNNKIYSSKKHSFIMKKERHFYFHGNARLRSAGLFVRNRKRIQKK